MIYRDKNYCINLFSCPFFSFLLLSIETTQLFQWYILKMPWILFSKCVILLIHIYDYHLRLEDYFFPTYYCCFFLLFVMIVGDEESNRSEINKNRFSYFLPFLPLPPPVSLSFTLLNETTMERMKHIQIFISLFMSTTMYYFVIVNKQNKKTVASCFLSLLFSLYHSPSPSLPL